MLPQWEGLILIYTIEPLYPEIISSSPKAGIVKKIFIILFCYQLFHERNKRAEKVHLSKSPALAGKAIR